VELVYGIACWAIYRGGRGLLALVVLGNLANLTLFSAGDQHPQPGACEPVGFTMGAVLFVIVIRWLVGHGM
jgi:hypothetical protein